MRQGMCIVAAWMLVAGLAFSAAGTSWGETDAHHSITPHPRTGEPILTFTVWMEYDPAPRCMVLSTEWTMSVIENGSEEVLVTDVRPRRRSCVGIGKFFSLSPAVEAIPGRHYRATLRLEDTQNELTHEHSFDYVAPDPLPAGGLAVILRETPTVNTGGISASVRSRIAEYFDTLSTDYRQTATAVSLAEFFSDYAASQEDFPAMIFVVPVSDAGQTAGEGDTATNEHVNRVVFFFTLPSPNTGNIVLNQLASEEDEGEAEIVGRVFVGDGDSSLGAVTVFVHEAAWEVLQTAQEE